MICKNLSSLFLPVGKAYPLEAILKKTLQHKYLENESLPPTPWAVPGSCRWRRALVGTGVGTGETRQQPRPNPLQNQHLLKAKQCRGGSPGNPALAGTQHPAPRPAALLSCMLSLMFETQVPVSISLW